MGPKIKLFILLLLTLTTVASSAACKPKWVKERPISDTYYIGIARVSTAAQDFIQVAKNKAIADIISEISIELTSTSVFHQLEENDQLKDTYESWTKTKIQNELEGYELVDTYTKKGEYWVYYRLDIATYKKIKLAKLEAAKKESQTYLESALEAQSNGDIGSAMSYFSKSFKSIEGHLKEDLSVFILDHGRIDLASFIYKSIVEMFDTMSFNDNQEALVFTPLSSTDLLVIDISYNGKPAQNMPLLVGNYSRGLDTFQKTITSSSGQAQLPVQNLQAGTNQELKVMIDLDATLGTKTSDNILRSMFSQSVDAASDMYRVNVGTQNVLFKAASNKRNKMILATAKTQLSKYLFSEVSTESNAKFIVKMKAHWNADDLDERYNLYKVSLDFSFDVYHIESQKVIYHNEVNDIKGMKSGSLLKAQNDALEKLELVFTEQFVPEINLIKIK